jgi:hypothetical protein
MIAYYRPKAEPVEGQPQTKRSGLSNELFHGLTPEQFDDEAVALSKAQSMTPQVRARLKAQLIERLKTPVDEPSWGPDWVRRGEKVAAHRHRKPGVVSRMLPFGRTEEEDEDDTDDPLNTHERTDAEIIARNMEKSRQVAHYRPLYLVAVGLAVAVALLAMFVDYQIIRGDVWTRALANEFMVVPASLQSSVVFKSLQVLFAVLIVHFMLKITGVYGRNAMITAAFLFALVMIGCLGYLVAYNNMAGATSATQEQRIENPASQSNSIDQLFASMSARDSAPAAETPRITKASMTEGVSLGLPKLSQASLANADSWFWLAFASVIFFIVTTVAALYMQTAENNVRNFHIARDYKHRQRQMAQLHLLELADRRDPAERRAA